MHPKIPTPTRRRALKLLLLTPIAALIRVPAANAQSIPPTSTPHPTLVERTWTVEGVTRRALLYLPPNATREKTPVVFAFHGHGGSMQQAARSFAYERQWPEAMVVYPQGLDTVGQLTDPDGARAGWQARQGDQSDRDLKFFDAILATLKTDYQIDDTRLFVTGHSNGGGFTYLLWATRGKLLLAVAPSSAIPAVGSFPLLTPKPVLHLAGVADPLVRYAWQQRTIQRLKRLNGCTTDGTPWAKSGPLTGTLYPSPTGTPVVTILHPGGHVFPAEAPALIVRFFREMSPPTP